MFTPLEDFLNRWLWGLNTYAGELSEIEEILVELMVAEALEMPEEIIYDDTIPIKTK